jgi:hypothetical protein
MKCCRAYVAACIGEEAAAECGNCYNCPGTGTARAALIATVKSRTAQLSPYQGDAAVADKREVRRFYAAAEESGSELWRSIPPGLQARMRHSSVSDYPWMVQLKLGELLRPLQGARNALSLEGLEEEDLDRIRTRHIELAEKARADSRSEQTTKTDDIAKQALNVFSKYLTPPQY